MPRKTRALFVAALAAPLLIAPSDIRAVDQDQADGPTPAFLAFSGGAVEGTRARTEAAPTNLINFPSGPFFNLPNAVLTWFVPAGDSDLLSVSFSAECTKSNGRVFIRVLDNGVQMNPVDLAQPFCSGPAHATYTGTWVRRSAGAAFLGTNHTLVVQLLNTTAGGIIDDWTFALVAYN
jgi:hypothetical protein